MINNSYDMRQYEQGRERANLRECKISLAMAFTARSVKPEIEPDTKNKGAES